MPCLFGCLALIFPRVALALVWFLVPGYLGRAVDPWWWGLLGFLFMPLTTLAFAYGINSVGPAGVMPPLGWVLVVVAGLVDLGLLGGGTRSSRD
ncbi:MAG: hypothetical protein ACOCXM_09345 [Myxococcota bacterium]